MTTLQYGGFMIVLNTPFIINGTTPRRKTLSECILNLSWAWYSVVMGIGNVAALAAAFPFGRDTLSHRIVSLVIFLVNLVVFVVICVGTVARYWMFPQMRRQAFRHPTQSLYVGAFAVGFSTLIDSAVVVNTRWRLGGLKFLYAMWGLWWFDIVVSALITFGIIYEMMTTQKHVFTKLSFLWLFPVIPLVVASASGGNFAKAIHPHSTTNAIITVAVSFVAFTISVSLSLMIITAYLIRLALHGPPGPSLVMSSLVSLGPLANGTYSLLVNGQVLAEIYPDRLSATNFPSILSGSAIFAVCFSGAWVLWSMGIAWSVIGLTTIYSVTRTQKIPFSLAYWGTVFPTGSFALASVQFYDVLGSAFFRYFGAVTSVLVAILCAAITIRSLIAIWDTSIFIAADVVAPMGDIDKLYV